MNFSIEKKIIIKNVSTLKDLIEFLHSLNEKTNIKSLLDFEIVFENTLENDDTTHQELNELLKLYNPTNTKESVELNDLSTEDDVILDFID